VNLFAIRHGETTWSLSRQHTGTADMPLKGAGSPSGYGRFLPERRSRSFSAARCDGRARLANWRVSATGPLSTRTWSSGITTSTRGLTPRQIRATAPRWQIFRDGCPGGEAPEQISERMDRVILRARAADGDVALFAHGHVLRVLVARWIGSSGAGQRFLIDIGYAVYPRLLPLHTRVRVWNGPLTG
jgi:Histidine phosphatase superfamily (branch 1)